MEHKKSFVLYCDLIHTVNRLPDDVAGELFKHVLSYVNDENPVTDNLLIEVCFEPIKQQLKRDLCKWQERKAKRVEAGKKGGLAKSSNARKKVANLPVNGNVNGNVNVNVSVINEIEDLTLRAVFQEFIEHRKQIKKPMSEMALKRMVKKVNRHDPQTAEAMLIQSIENGWSGIYKIKGATNGTTRAEQAIQNINAGGNEDLNQIEGLGSF